MPESGERGALTEAVYYILLSLYQPMHGYGIMQRVAELSEDRVKLGAGTLYGAVNTLLEKRWIKNYINEEEKKVSNRKKEYVITDLGKEIVKQEIDRLEELIKNGQEIAGR